MASSRGALAGKAMPNGPAAALPPAVPDDSVGAPGSMYRLKPFYDTTAPLALPTCMYRLDPLYEVRQDAPGGSGNADVTLETLERRQDRILARLEALRREVDLLLTSQSTAGRGQGSVGGQGSACARRGMVQGTLPRATHATEESVAALRRAGLQQQAGGATSGAGPALVDLVLTADPRCPPLAPLVLFELLTARFTVLPASHVHSSLPPGLAATLIDLFDCGGGGMSANRSDYQLGFTVVWKQLAERDVVSLVVRSSAPMRLEGEFTVARFLARLLGCYDDASDIVTATRIDEMLDIAVALVAAGNDAPRRAQLLKCVSATLGRSQWMLGAPQPSLADIALWSAVRQNGGAGSQAGGCSGGKAPDNLRRWMEACESRPEFALASSVLP